MALIICLTGFASCNKDIPISQEQEPASVESGRYLSVSLSASTNDVRLAQVVDADGAIVSPFMEERDLVIRLIVRKQGGAPDQVKIQDVVFKKTPSAPDATYKGKIQIPDGLTPIAGDVYEICGILLREATDSGTVFLTPGATIEDPVATTTNTELLIADSESKLATKIPYLAGWTPITVSSDTSNFGEITLTFEPSGSIIRFSLDRQQTIENTINSIKIKTNAFFTDWQYNPKDPFIESNLAAGSRSDAYIWERTYQLPGGSIALGAGSEAVKKHYYMWVMPAISHALSYIEIDALATDGSSYLAYYSHTKPSIKYASTIPLTLREERNVFPGGKLPLEYVAEYNVAPDGKSLVKSHWLDESGYFRWNEYTWGDVHVSSYRKAFSDEWKSIFPAINISFNNSNRMEVTEVNIRLAGQAIYQSYLADYLVSSIDKTIYAVRFLGGDNRLATAYRYSWRSHPENHLEIKSKYLGDEFIRDGKTVYNLTSSTFWSDAKTAIFPATGESEGSNKGREGIYWGDSRYDISTKRARIIHFDESGIRHTFRDEKNKYAVRLIR